LCSKLKDWKKRLRVLIFAEFENGEL
jgi:hypothetical protein